MNELLHVMAELWLSRVVQALIPGTCEYVMLHGKKDFSDVFKVMDLKEINLDYLGGTNLIISSLKSREFPLARVR